MFDNLKNLGALMGQMRELSAKAEQLQTRLGERTVEADTGAGAVRVVANGRLEVLSVRVDGPLLASLAGGGAEAERAMVEALIAGAVNAALDKARLLVKEEVLMLTGGLSIPGLERLLGQ